MMPELRYPSNLKVPVIARHFQDGEPISSIGADCRVLPSVCQQWCKEVIGVGLSGGVDSAVAALLLLRAGHEVLGFTMRLTDTCSEAAVTGGQKVAAQLGIPHQVLDLRHQFNDLVLRPFIDAYASGMTPSPCPQCNATVKFGLLWEQVAEHGCSHLATGHYARREEISGRMVLKRGLDASKDQSYFLALLSQSQLRRTMLPLGEMHKQEVRRIAENNGLLVARQGDSQDLCFLPGGDFAGWIADQRPDLAAAGWIVDLNGKRLGRHQGAFQYTVGQRRGLGLGGGPWFVVRTDLERQEVVVGREKDLQQNVVYLRNMNWLRPEPAPGEEWQVAAQLRYLMKPRTAKLRSFGDGKARLEFAEPILAVAPGQLAVAYQDDEVLAGGWIEESTTVN